MRFSVCLDCMGCGRSTDYIDDKFIIKTDDSTHLGCLLQSGYTQNLKNA